MVQLYFSKMFGSETQFIPRKNTLLELQNPVYFRSIFSHLPADL